MTTDEMNETYENEFLTCGNAWCVDAWLIKKSEDMCLYIFDQDEMGTYSLTWYSLKRFTFDNVFIGSLDGCVNAIIEYQDKHDARWSYK